MVDGHFDQANGEDHQARQNGQNRQQPKADRVSIRRPESDIELERDKSDAGNDDADNQESWQ